MAQTSYTVAATLPDEATAGEYIRWLQDGHVDAVIAHCAQSAAIVRLDPASPGSGIVIETRYIFPSRDVYQRYDKEYAPVLRQEGVEKFGGREGVSFSRSLGTVL